MVHRRLIRSGALALALCANAALAAPTFTTTGFTETSVNQTYRYNAQGRIEATGTGVVSYELIAGPAGLRVDPFTGVVRWVPTGVGAFPFTVQAKDETGVSEQTTTVTVIDVATTVTASISSNTTSGAGPLTVTFTVTASSDRLDALAVFWEAGDGTPSERGEGATWTHVYRLPGTYTARVTVFDQHGASTTAEKLIQVKDANGNVPPKARILANTTSGAEPLSVSLSCECVAGTAAISKYLWTLNGNIVSRAETGSGSFEAGRHQIALMVVDANGLTARAELELTVTRDGNIPPRCFARANPSVGPVPAEVAFSVETEPGTAPIKRVEWTRDDWSVDRAFVTSRSYDTAGWYVSRVEVEDELGLKCQASASFAGTSASGALPPAVLSSAPSAAVCGEKYEYVPEPLVSGSLAWNLESAPTGMAVDASSGKVTWVPAPNQRGEYTFALVASGEAGQAVEHVWVAVTCPDKVALDAPFGCAAGGFELVAGGVLLVAAALRRRRRR